MISSVFKTFGFLGILGPPYCGIGATVVLGTRFRILFEFIKAMISDFNLYFDKVLKSLEINQAS